jgi:hypothetical protein
MVIVTVGNSDNISGEGELTITGCPDTIFIHPPNQEVKLSSNKT